MIEPIKVEGLAQFQRSIKKLDGDLPKVLRIALNGVAGIVVDAARAKVPRRTGRAAASLKAISTQSKARVQSGGRKAPYMPWLDFGGRVGRNRSVVRPFRKEGRYVWKALGDNRDQVTAALTEALVGVARQAGLEVSDG